MDTYDLVSKHPLLAILRNVPLEKTIDYAEAAVQGGAPFFEVALNSPHALEQITMLRTHFGDRCTVGAGTAITVERCKAALDAGAQFLLTPGTPLDVFSYCAENDIALLPGVLTPHRRGHQPAVRLQDHEAVPRPAACPATTSRTCRAPLTAPTTWPSAA